MITSMRQLIFITMHNKNLDTSMLSRWFFVKGAFDEGVPQFWVPYSEAILVLVGSKPAPDSVQKFRDGHGRPVMVEWLVSEEGLSNAGLLPPYVRVPNVDWGRLFSSLNFFARFCLSDRSNFWLALTHFYFLQVS